MSIDYGDARVGIALSDPLQMISSGFTTLKNDNMLLDNIKLICQSKNVESIVIGIPFNQDSDIGYSAKKVLLFVKSLKEYLLTKKIKITIYEQDERYSTHEAINIMRELKVKRKKKKNIVDQIAAERILSSFMNSKNKIKLEIERYLNL